MIRLKQTVLVQDLRTGSLDKTGGEDNVDSLDSWSRWQSNETVQPMLYCSWTKLLTQTLNFDLSLSRFVLFSSGLWFFFIELNDKQFEESLLNLEICSTKAYIFKQIKRN